MVLQCDMLSSYGIGIGGCDTASSYDYSGNASQASNFYMDLDANQFNYLGNHPTIDLMSRIVVCRKRNSEQRSASDCGANAT